MPLPPNVTQERREDGGSRHIHDLVNQVFANLKKHFDEQMELLKEAVDAKLENHVSYRALFLAMLGTVVAVIVGVLGLYVSTRSQVDVAKAATDAKIEKVDTALQAFKAETGAEVKGIYRFLLEGQNKNIIRQQVEQQKRDEAPPPEPLNPLVSPKKGRR